MPIPSAGTGVIMDSAVLSGEVREQRIDVEPEDASDDVYWWAAEPPAGPFADERFIL